MTNLKFFNLLNDIKNDDMIKRKINKHKYVDFNKDFDKIKKYLTISPYYKDTNSFYKLSICIMNIINVIENESK